MKYLVISFLFSFIQLCHGQSISEDDKSHFIAGAVISTGIYTMVHLKTKDKKKAFWYSFGAATVAGVIKETLDSSKPNNRFDTGEAATSSLGGLTASITLSLFIGKSKAKKRKSAMLFTY